MKSKIIHKDGKYSLITKIKDTNTGERELKIHCIKRDYDNFGKGTGEIIDIPLPKENKKEVYTKTKEFLKTLPREVSREKEMFYYKKINFILFYDLDKDEILIGVGVYPKKLIFNTFKEFRNFVYLEKYKKSYKQYKKEQCKEMTFNILKQIIYIPTIGYYKLLIPSCCTEFKKLSLPRKICVVIIYLFLYATLLGTIAILLTPFPTNKVYTVGAKIGISVSIALVGAAISLFLFLCLMSAHD